MKKRIIIIFLLFICFSSYCEDSDIKSSFSSVLPELLKGNNETIEEVKKGNVQSCDIVKLLSWIKNEPEEVKLEIVKLAGDNNGIFISLETTALIEAVRINNYQIVEYLLTKKDVINTIEITIEQFAPPLFWALQNGNKEIAELLLKNGANPNFKTRYGDNAFESIDEFVEYKSITLEKAEELKLLLTAYGYQSNFPSTVKLDDILTVKENLRLRQNEQTSSQIITTLQKGSPVKVILLGKYETIDGINGRWLYVELQQNARDRDGNFLAEGIKGWCYGGYLK